VTVPIDRLIVYEAPNGFGGVLPLPILENRSQWVDAGSGLSRVIRPRQAGIDTQ
jgi:hypothetical protein